MVNKIFTLHNIYFKYGLIIIVCLVAAMIITKLLRMILNRFFYRSSSKLNIDPTQFNFMKNAVSFVVFLGAIITIFYLIPELKALGVTLFASAGIMAVIIGFASKEAFANIINGIFIVIYKPFRVGDWVNIQDKYTGTVEDITLRHTVIRDFENKRVVIPNSVVNTETIVNASIMDEKICQFIELGISYDANVDQAIQVIQEEAMAHPFFIDNRSEEERGKNAPAVIVRLIGFGDSSVKLRAYVWANNPSEAFIMKCDLNKSIKEHFDRDGIEIPFPYRTIVFKKDI